MTFDDLNTKLNFCYYKLIEISENFDFESCNHIFVINNQFYHIVKQYFTIEMKTKKRSKMTSCLRWLPLLIKVAAQLCLLVH